MQEKVRLIKNTEYNKLLEDSNSTIGITHHKDGLGKLKIKEGKLQYEVPVTDVINKHLSEWRIKNG